MAERGSIGIYFNAGMVLALLAGGFLLVQPPIKSQRPQGNTGIEQERDGKKRLSRLWQDPFESARILEKEREQDRKSRPPVTSKPGTIEYVLEQMNRLRKAADDFPFNKVEDVFSELLWNNVLGPEGGSLFEAKPIQFNQDKLQNTLSGISVFAVMVPGKPYQDQAERRIRYRVALAHGMSESGYRPMDAERIGCFLFRTRSRDKNSDDLWANMRQLWRAEVQPEIPVPYEWFRQKEGEGKILVLWIDEDAFSVAPLMLLNLLRRNIDQQRANFFCRQKRCPRYSSKPDREECKHLLDDCGHCTNERGKYHVCHAHALKLNVIGPYSSTTLRRICDEQRTYGNETIRKEFERLFSLPEKECSCAANPNPLLCFYNYSATNQDEKNTPEQSSVKFFEIHHLVSSDTKLMGAMHRELDLRKWPWPLKREVILISEHDTEYGRQLPETFKKGHKDKFEYCQYGYLRGIDGTTAAEASAREEKRLAGNTPSQSEKDIAKVLSRWTQGKHTNPPLGNNQLDYIARLTMELKEKHSTPFAIGILGSDTYDKLMLLQSLRPVFPDALFFTTDLDSQYLDVESVRTAHGLLVASSYGFSLHPNIQKNTPPFRGNYQTALFHAVRAAAGDPDAGMALFLKQPSVPRIFEIGWYNPVDLTMESMSAYEPFSGNITEPGNYYLEKTEEKITLHPRSPRVSPDYELFFKKNTWKILLFVFLFISLALTLFQFNLVKELVLGEWIDKIHPANLYDAPCDRWYRRICFVFEYGSFAFLILVVPSIVWYVHLRSEKGGEPFLLWEGVSSWPLFIVHCGAVYLGCSFLFVATRISQKLLSRVRENVFKDEKVKSKDEKIFILNAVEFTPFLSSFAKGKAPAAAPRKNATNPPWKQWVSYCSDTKKRCSKMSSWFLVVFAFSAVFLVLMCGCSNWTVLRGDGFGIGMLAVASGIVASYLILNFLTCIVVADNIFGHQFISDISPKRSVPTDEAGVKSFSLETSEHFKIVRMIGEWTHITRNLVWLPTILLFILTVARIGVIENFGRGETIRLCYGLVIALLIFLPVCKLYAEARKLRKALIDDMKNQMIELQSSGKKEPGIKPEQIKVVIEEMEKYQKGIYSPWLWHPMASAFLVLSGGISFPLLLDFFFR